MSEQLDRIEQKIDGLISALTHKESPFNRPGGSPEVKPAIGFEKVFGPRPKDATDLVLWRNHAARVTRVETAVPEDLSDGVLEFVAETKVKPIFVEYNDEWLAAITTGPKAWLVPVNRFEGSNVQGLIRAVKDANL